MSKEFLSCWLLENWGESKKIDRVDYYHYIFCPRPNSRATRLCSFVLPYGTLATQAVQNETLKLGYNVQRSAIFADLNRKQLNRMGECLRITLHFLCYRGYTVIISWCKVDGTMHYSFVCVDCPLQTRFEALPVCW